MLLFDQLTEEIQIARGDTETLRVIVVNSAGVVYDVSANAFKFTVKQTIEDAIGAALFQLTNPAASGIDLTNADVGIVDVKIPGAYTLGMAGDYVYDLQMTDADGDHTLFPGRAFKVLKDVTDAGAVGGPPTFIAPFVNGIALTPPFFIFSPNGDLLWHKFDIINDGFGNYLLTDVGQNPTYPF